MVGSRSSSGSACCSSSLGERLFGHEPGVRVRADRCSASSLVIAVTGAARVDDARHDAARAARVERTLLLCHLGTLLALVLYALTTNWGMAMLGDRPRRAPRKFGARVLTVLWAIVLLASIVPVLMIELVARHRAAHAASTSERPAATRRRRVLPRARHRLVGPVDRARARS